MVPTYRFHQQQAARAFAAHKALVLMEMASPELAENPSWVSTRQEAFDLFLGAFERIPETSK
jgi:hypothetical protein